jgi:hypothetical protein
MTTGPGTEDNGKNQGFLIIHEKSILSDAIGKHLITAVRAGSKGKDTRSDNNIGDVIGEARASKRNRIASERHGGEGSGSNGIMPFMNTMLERMSKLDGSVGVAHKRAPRRMQESNAVRTRETSNSTLDAVPDNGAVGFRIQGSKGAAKTRVCGALEGIGAVMITNAMHEAELTEPPRGDHLHTDGILTTTESTISMPHGRKLQRGAPTTCCDRPSLGNGVKTVNATNGLERMRHFFACFVQKPDPRHVPMRRSTRSEPDELQDSFKDVQSTMWCGKSLITCDAEFAFHTRLPRKQ